MKIWKLILLWDEKDVLTFPKKLSAEERQIVKTSLLPGYHVHRNPIKRPKQAPGKEVNQ